jgi:hypothetical protein
MQQRQHPQKMYISSMNAYSHFSRNAPYQFGNSIPVSNIAKVAFTDQDDAKSAPTSASTSPLSSPRQTPFPSSDSLNRFPFAVRDANSSDSLSSPPSDTDINVGSSSDADE